MKYFLLEKEHKVELQRSTAPAELKEQEDINDAAVKIQSTYRGYVTRKELNEGKF